MTCSGSARSTTARRPRSSGCPRVDRVEVSGGRGAASATLHWRANDGQRRAARFPRTITSRCAIHKDVGGSRSPYPKSAATRRRWQPTRTGTSPMHAAESRLPSASSMRASCVASMAWPQPFARWATSSEATWTPDRPPAALSTSVWVGVGEPSAAAAGPDHGRRGRPGAAVTVGGAVQAMLRGTSGAGASRWTTARVAAQPMADQSRSRPSAMSHAARMSCCPSE